MRIISYLVFVGKANTLNKMRKNTMENKTTKITTEKQIDKLVELAVKELTTNEKLDRIQFSKKSKSKPIYLSAFTMSNESTEKNNALGQYLIEKVHAAKIHVVIPDDGSWNDQLCFMSGQRVKAQIIDLSDFGAALEAGKQAHANELKEEAKKEADKKAEKAKKEAARKAAKQAKKEAAKKPAKKTA